MKQLFRHTNTTQSLVGFARWAVVLLAMFCYVGGAWGQTLVRKGTINSQDDVALYNQMMAECPVDITWQLGDLSSWTGDNITHTGRSGQHWNGNSNDTYSENNNGWNWDSWTASMTKTIILPKGKYLFIGPGRSSQNVEAYFKVGDLSARVHNGGDTGLGINTSDQPSFLTTDNFMIHPTKNVQGCGWRYTYIQFDVAYESSVTFKIEASANAQQQFMSFTNPKLLKLSEELRTDMFKTWNGSGGNATITNNNPNGVVIKHNQSTDVFYGFENNTVSYTNYADLTDYSTLELTVSEGTPRLFFNKLTEEDASCLEVRGDNTTYVTIEGDKYIINLDKVANEGNLGYVHLNGIKGYQYLASVNISSATLTGPSLRSIFHQWDGTSAGSSVTVVNPANFVWRVGEEVAAGSAIYGYYDGGVPQNQYADLTPYNKMVVTYDNEKQPPRFMFNKASDGSSTFVVEVNGQNSGYLSVSDNRITIDLAKLRNDNGGYVHLNGIKSTNDNGGSTIVYAVDLSQSFTPSTDISRRVNKTFVLNKDEWLQNNREFTVQFNFDDWRLYLYGDTNQPPLAQLSINYGSNPENYWYVYYRFYDHTLHFGNGENPINSFYVHWYLKDQSGNVVNINNSLINEYNIYQQTITSQDGVVWSSGMGSPVGNERDLHKILRMTIDGTPTGGEHFDLTKYSLVCAISEAGNEGYINNKVSSDASPVSIEYTFYFTLKEIPVTDKMVTHKMSYLKGYAGNYSNLSLSEQGLASDIDSDWWNNDRKIQKTNHFEITHYVKQGTSLDVYFPTILDGSNDHINYQRWYNYDEAEDNMDLDRLKRHISLDTNNGNVQYYLYKNGIVTGDRLYWDSSSPDLKHSAQDHIVYTNFDGQSFTLAADVSRYSDYKYEKPSDPLSGNLEEPSLTMRYIYYMKDASEMASDLSQEKYKWTSDGDVDENHWKEKKTFHFPAKQVFYNDNKWEGYRGEFIGLRHVFSDYWVYNNGELISAVNDDNASGKIEIKIYDPHGTGIRLGGYNPNIGLRGTQNRPIVGDVIRVYYKDKIDEPGDNENDFNPIFKHASDGNPDWTEFQNNMTVTDNYFEAPIPNGSLDELFSSGLRLQGRGFTLVKVVCIPQSGYGDRYPLIIYDQETVFNGWGVQPTIGQQRIYVGLNNEGNDGDYQGFYFYDKMNTAWGAAPDGKTQYGDSRFIVFRYPKGNDGKTAPVTKTGIGNEVYLHVYFKVNETTKYQLAQFTLIFDEGCETLPWISVNGSDYVKGTDRDPKNLRNRAGKPIAKISFDYPSGDTYHYPPSGTTLHHNGEQQPNGTIANSSPLPLTFDHTNYSFDGDGCNWAAYAMVSEKSTEWGNNKMTYPADANELYGGYNIDADNGMQKGFLYIDASEQPGDICAADFVGEFCEDDQLMCSGWITGSNRYSDNGSYRCPGGITLTVKGEPLEGGENETIYRFCPGQCYELDNGSGIDGSEGASRVVWQQFYFKFSTDKKYKRYWMEVNNNCVSSNGGDFMLDNIEVYAIVPEVEPDVNTPLCVSVDEEGNTVTEMRLLKIKINYNKLLSSRTLVTADSEHPENIGTAEEGFVFLEKYKFLETFRTELAKLSNEKKTEWGLTAFDFNNITLDELALAIEKGELHGISSHPEAYAEGSAYKTAFDAAILGERSTWHSDSKTENMKSSIMYFRWNSNYEAMEEFSFARAVNKKNAVFREEIGGEKYVVMNGNYPGLDWKTNTDYYIINTANRYDPGTPESPANPCNAFNLCSPCCKSSTFQIDSPYSVLGLEKSEGTEDYVVCEGQIPTVALNLKGFDLSGNEVDMTGLNFDWWLGNNAASTAADKLATLDNYHKQHKVITYEEAGVTKTKDVKLDKALAALRSYYPSITSLDGVIQHLDKTPNLSLPEVLYLQEVVSDGQLVLHQSSISVPAEKNSDEDPYFYLVACPIHDEAFNQALNPQDNEYVAYFCDEPQGLRIKVGQKAPTLMTGFVPGEHGFNTYDYAFPEGTNPVLSIRLAKAAQFETVKNEDAEDTSVSTTVNYLWLPIRNAVTQGAPGVFTKASDDNIYLASSNDPTWDKKISKQMSKTGSLPIVGRIVQLEAINTSGQSEEDLKTSTTLQANNRLSVYFTKGFEVREGYNYTLSLPFQEKPDENGDVNSCDGTILINLKIVPDYEVWTGGAGNTDWNNDENWRRADGNTTISNDYYGDELYIANGAKDDENSPLHDYTTNKDNYYSSSKKATAKPSSDQVLRKGFAPLYCTHVLMKSDEWGNAPVLYDAIDGHDVITQTGSRLINAPFPNLRDTSTPILKFDMQARRWDMWEETYGTAPDRGNSDGSRPNDLIAEMYQINSCDEIAMQPGTELLNAQLLNYNSAWMEFELETKRWYLLGSPLQGTISGEWYAPTATEKMGYVPQQKTTYYDDVKFGAGYDRYNPAIYQRSWDKAKAVLYEVGSTYSTADDVEVAGQTYGDGSQGEWKNNGTADVPNWQWQEPTGGADDYLDRLGYKPMGGKKANVAIQGIWSNTYNDAQVDYATGGFSVMVMNHLKGNAADVKAIVRLPKEDKMYDYYEFSEDGSDDGGTDTNISDVQTKDRADYTKRATNRGRLKTDLLLPTQDGIQKSEKEAATYRYVDRRTITRIPIKEADLTTMNSGTFSFTEKVAAGASNLVYYLVENPFPCGLDMTAFFANENNSNLLEKKYWILTKGDDQNPRQQLVQQADGEWVTSDGTPGKWVTSGEEPIEYPNPEGEGNLTFYPNAVVAPGQGFFVAAKTANAEGITVTFTDEMQTQSRFGVIDGNGRTFKVVVGQAQKMEELTDDHGDAVYIEVDLDGDGIYGEDLDLNGNGTPGETYTKEVEEYGETVTRTVIEKEVEIVMVPVYQKDGDNYVLDEEGNKIPVLNDINEDVVIYKYKQEELTQTAKKEYPLRTRGEGAEAILPGLVITAERDNSQSSALVMQRSGASNDFLPEEDTEVFINSDLVNAPTVYTLCGRLATTINTLRDFRSLPLGVESTSDAPCTLTFRGVEMLGDSISFYDAVEQKLTPLESGMTVTVSGQTQNRYYLVRSLNKKDAAEETHLQIFTEGLKAKVIASTAEPITVVRCFDTGGRLLYTASPQSAEYSFDLPRAGVYIIEAETEHDRKTRKVIVK